MPGLEERNHRQLPFATLLYIYVGFLILINYVKSFGIFGQVSRYCGCGSPIPRYLSPSLRVNFLNCIIQLDHSAIQYFHLEILQHVGTKVGGAITIMHCRYVSHNFRYVATFK